MLDVRFVPLEAWPGIPTPAAKRRNATFRASYNKTLHLLENELSKLRAKNIVIWAWFSFAQLRNDGWPFSNAQPSGVGVIVSFHTPQGDFSFPCDTFTAFDDNLRAIALALEALRAVDRYGVTKRNEQYAGWKQLPQPSDQPFRTKEEAASFLATQAGYTDRAEFVAHAILTEQAERQTVYRQAAARLHPDSNGGSHELFVRLQAAKKLLEA
jgi:hypothetical protein